MLFEVTVAVIIGMLVGGCLGFLLGCNYEEGRRHDPY